MHRVERVERIARLSDVERARVDTHNQREARRASPPDASATSKLVTVFTGDEGQHLRGIGMVSGGKPTGIAGGASPNTRPGRTFCTYCGIRSGQHHHRSCEWKGRLP